MGKSLEGGVFRPKRPEKEAGKGIWAEIAAISRD
jgi:hypothetical protein